MTHDFPAVSAIKSWLLLLCDQSNKNKVVCSVFMRANDMLIYILKSITTLSSRTWHVPLPYPCGQEGWSAYHSVAMYTGGSLQCSRASVALHTTSSPGQCCPADKKRPSVPMFQPLQSLIHYVCSKLGDLAPPLDPFPTDLKCTIHDSP